jgi:hypothetical protein
MLLRSYDQALLILDYSCCPDGDRAKKRSICSQMPYHMYATSLPYHLFGFSRLFEFFLRSRVARIAETLCNQALLEGKLPLP